LILTKDLRVDYQDVTAVADLNLSIEPGEVFGLIGPNGAGKTSTIRVLATLQLPTYGEVQVGGMDALESPREVHRILGYMPDLPPVYEDLKCWEFLELFASAYFVDRRTRMARVDECLSLVNLTSKREAMAGTLSRGMTQRLVLAKTILPDPSVLLLDEPASGLDPNARIELRDLLKMLGERGKTVLVSSHILTELQEMCTSIGIMEKGHLLESGRISDIIERLRDEQRIVRIELLDYALHEGELKAAVEGVGAFVEVPDGLALQFMGSDQDLAELLRTLVSKGLPIKGFREQTMGVEDIMKKIGAREVS